MRYHLVPLGCQMNISDSERLRAVLESLGYVRTESEEDADLLGIVACSVRQKSIDKVYSRIHKWNTWKKSRQLITFVSGCILPADHDKFLDRFDLVFPITGLPHLPELLQGYGMVTEASIRAAEIGAGRESAREPAEVIPREALDDSKRGYWRIPPDYASDFEAYVPIQNGCDKFCAFCAVPYTRGREVSRPSGEILAEVERLVTEGYKSITLLGQNVNSYGLDRANRKSGAEITFPGLLRRIGEIGRSSGRRFWTYFTSPHPHDMSGELIDTIAEYEVLGRQIHLPIQSGDDEVLRRMNRGYGIDEYRSIVRAIRSRMPEASLFTDVIVGFTGETEEQFEATRRAMEEFRYNMAYVAAYSPRPGAASARWDDDVPQAEKLRRLHDLGTVLQRTSGEYNRALVGAEVSVLVDGIDRKPGYLTGKTEGRLIVRFPSTSGDLIGEFVTVRIETAAALSMEGTLLAVEPDTLAESRLQRERSREAFRAAQAGHAMTMADRGETGDKQRPA